MSHSYMAAGHCYGCRKPVGTDYLSHQYTDCPGQDGEHWDDSALCLCNECWAETRTFCNVSQFLAWRTETHPPKPPGPKYPPGSLRYAPESDCDGEIVGTDHFVLTLDGDDEVACAPDQELGQLFAAAPDLLAALKMFLHADPDVFKVELAAAKAAIAKATGVTQ